MSVAEEVLHRRVRTALRALWDAANQLEAATSPAPEPAAIAALRREAVRLASQALPFAAFADTAEDRLSLTRLMDQGLDDVPATEVERVLRVAKEAHARSLEVLEAPLTEALKAVRNRQLSFGLAVIGVGMLVAIIAHLWTRASLPKDLSEGRPFTLSSKWADCHPEQNDCGGYPTRIAFHTLHERSPWYQVDLGAPTTFRSATIINRQDAAMPLALPLVVEVSDDGKTFRELARRTELFTQWTPQFGTQTARYFRLRVDRASTLHLEAVRVHP